MSVTEKAPQWETQQLSKPACEMTAAEWEAHKAEVDRDGEARGEAPLHWHPQPQPISAKLRRHIRSMPLPDA
jgi:hypothetical protein